MDRQKIILIFGAAWVSAALLTWIVYAKTAGPTAVKTTTVIAAANDLPAGTKLVKNNLKRVRIPVSDVPRAAVSDESAALERALLYPVNANEPITSNKLASTAGVEGLPSAISPGKRAVSVPINDVSSAGGLIQPRSHVDVLFTRTGSMKEALTTTILQDVVVLSIGKQTEIATGPDAKNIQRPQNPSATLMVTPEEARVVELAKNQGKISLALRNPLDKSTLEENDAVTAEALNPLLARSNKRLAGMGPARSVRNNRAWQELTGLEQPKPVTSRAEKEEKKEPPKPRFVVDVYHGDKHVQEIFQ